MIENLENCARENHIQLLLNADKGFTLEAAKEAVESRLSRYGGNKLTMKKRNSNFINKSEEAKFHSSFESRKMLFAQLYKTMKHVISVVCDCFLYEGFKDLDEQKLNHMIAMRSQNSSLYSNLETAAGFMKLSENEFCDLGKLTEVII
jgi:hypothetical protein